MSPPTAIPVSVMPTVIPEGVLADVVVCMLMAQPLAGLGSSIAGTGHLVVGTAGVNVTTEAFVKR